MPGARPVWPGARRAPVGAVLTIADRIVAESHDQVFARSDPTAHAERLVISEYAAQFSKLRLDECTLYSVVEPCFMCSGAIHWAKIPRLVFAASQASLGTLTGGGSKPSASTLLPAGQQRIEVIGPALEADAMAVLSLYPWIERRT